MNPTNKSNSTHHIAALDGLRGFAALLVFASHSSMDKMNLIPGFNAMWFGKIGVFLFFLLSAYLLARPFLGRGLAAFKMGALGSYFKKRFLRIYPLFTIYLLCAFVTTWLSTSVFSAKNPDGIPLTIDLPIFLKHLFLARGDGVTWSIAVEFKFYFLLPIVLFPVILLNRSGRCITGMAVITALIAGSCNSFPPSEMIKNDMRIQYYFPAFLLGILTAALIESGILEAIRLGRHKLDIAAVTSLVICLVTSPPFMALFQIAAENRQVHQEIVLQTLLFCPVLLAIASNTPLMHRIFTLDFLKFIGKISFSLYLWHPMFIKGTPRFLPKMDGTILAWIILGFTIIGSYVSYRIIELPFQNPGRSVRDLLNWRSTTTDALSTDQPT